MDSHHSSKSLNSLELQAWLKEKLADAQKQHRTLDKTVSDLHAERKALIGDGKPRDLKKDLKRRHTAFETALKQHEKKISDARSDLETQQELLKTREAEHDQYTKEQAVLEEAFSTGLKETGFADEAAFGNR